MAIEKVTYLNQPNCYKLSNDEVELIVTTDMGPRIIRYGFSGSENVLGEVPDMTLESEFGTFRLLGGHRLWVAPEEKPRTYMPDNGSVEFEIKDDYTIRLTQSADARMHIEKEITIALDKTGSGVHLTHRLTNRGQWSIEAAAWAITIMAGGGGGGGVAILPNEPYHSWSEILQPARPLVVWYYTDLSDARFRIGKKFIRLTSDKTKPEPQKIGILNKQGWAAYQRQRTLFVKHFNYVAEANYPDYNCNTEVYTAGSFIEVESLSPLQAITPNASIEHVERWSLLKTASEPGSEDEYETLLPTSKNRWRTNEA
ncbi:MAG: hypothetical protein NVSMB56_04040 [Pyrinomonadaceae bacterium]